MLVLTCVAALALTLQSVHADDECLTPEPIDYLLNDFYCNQPIFLAFEPRSPQVEMLDNVCVTYFPLPDDPDTYQVYTSKVYCDGSNQVTTSLKTQVRPGVHLKAAPSYTETRYTFGYVGCDTYVLSTCVEFGDEEDAYVQGFTYQCRALALSCLAKVEEVLADACFPEDDYYILPMKLPNRCVTQQLCVLPTNPFYPELPGVALI